MRILSAVALVTLLSAAPLAAQSRSYGVKAGVNLSTISFDPQEGDNPYVARTGVFAGAFATFRLGGWLTIQPEAIYTVKGARLDLEGIESQLILDYVEIPVLLRFRLPGRVYAVAGPTIAVNVRARSRTRFTGSTEEIDISDEIERLDAGVAGGLGLELGAWLFEGRYTHGLSDIDREEGAKVRNRTVSFSAGIRF